MRTPKRISHRTRADRVCWPSPPPGWAIIHEHPFRQAIAPKGRGQGRLHRGALFVPTRLQADREAGMVIQHRQGMAAALGNGKVAFEVHLPQAIGGYLFKAMPRLMLTPVCCTQPLMAPQNSRHGARTGQGRLPLGLQVGAEFAPTPGGMGIPHRYDHLLERRHRLTRRPVWPVVTLDQRFQTPGTKPLQPLVTGLGTDAIPVAQGSHLDLRLVGQQDKLLPYCQRHSLLRHQHSPLGKCWSA